MAGADEGDGRLRVGPYLSRDDSESVVVVQPPTGPPEDARNEVTQLLPLVTAVGPTVRPAPAEEPTTGETGIVRAVAKRAAAALPALGPTTAGLSRTRNPATPVPADEDSGDVVFAEIIPDDPAPASNSPTLAAKIVPDGAGTDAEVIRPEPVLPPGGGVTPPGDVQVSMDAGPSAAVPDDGVGDVTLPRRYAHRDEFGEEGVGDVDDHAAEPDGNVEPDQSGPPQPGSRAFAEAETAEWILPGEPESGPEPATGLFGRPWHEVGRAGRTTPPPIPEPEVPRSPAYADPSSARVAELDRPGPIALDEDNWDGEPANPDAPEYAGRRRERNALRTWLGIAAAMIILAAAVGLPFLLDGSSSKPAGNVAAGQPSDNDDANLVDPAPGATTPNGQLGVPMSSGPAASTTPTRTPGPSSSAHAVAGSPAPSTSSSTTKPPAPPQPPPPPPFNPTTVQAENGSLSGAVALNLMCSGHTRVAGPLGSVTMSINVPNAATYHVQVFYADFAGNRSAQISANGGGAQTIGLSNSLGGDCVSAGPTASFSLHAGTNTITVGNASGNLVYLDRIVVSRA